jgi:hypothetical protein
MAGAGGLDAPIPGATSVGGAEGRRPTGDSYATIDLIPGEYLLICTIPMDDGTPHAAKGMHTSLLVKPAPNNDRRPGTRSPRPDLTLTAFDYAYQGDTNHLHSGWRTIRLVNRGPAAHIAEIGRLAPGKTSADVLRWAQGGFKGQPPMTPIGGTTRIPAGASSLFSVQLEKGRYAIYCRLLDAHDHEHVQLGMLRELIVE